jgi:hypothetical protein
MINDLLYFIKERHSIYLKKEKGLPKPWTKDEILQTYKFCNVYRELDTVTRWITRKIRGPYSTNRDLWFMLCIARQINWPDTLQELIDKKAWPINNRWDPMKACEVMRARQKQGEKIYTGSYMLRGDIQKAEGPNDKPLYTCMTVLGGVWDKRKLLEPKMHSTLEKAHKALLGNHGWGSFLAAQVVADLKYAPQLKNASDWWTWAASGPGSRRGLNRVLGRPVTSPWDEVEWLSRLQDLSKEVAPHVKKWGMPELHNQDLQNCLCEYSKYAKVKDGTGRPRSLYPGKE